MKYKVAKRHCVRSSQGKLGLSSATTRFMSDYTTEYDSDAVKRHTKRPSLQPLLPVSRPQASAPSFFPSDSTSTQRDAATSGCSSRPFSGIFGLSSVQLSILPTPLVEGIRSHVGFLYVAAASACFTVVNSIVAFLSTSEDLRVSTAQLMATRMFITCICGWMVLKIQGDPNPILGPPEVRFWLAFRGVIGFLGIASNYYALAYLTVSEVTSTGFLVPLTTGIAAALILKEPYRPIEALAAIVSLFAVLLIAKPSFLFNPSAPDLGPSSSDTITEEERLTAIGVLLIGVVGGTGAYLTIRHIGKRASALHSLQYFGYYSCLVSFILMLFAPSQRSVMPKDPVFLIALLVIGILGFVAQVCLTLGLQKEKAGRAALATYLQLPLALIFDRVVFGQTPDILSLLGSFIIVASALGVVWTKSDANEANPPTPLTDSQRYSSISQDIDAASPRDTSLWSEPGGATTPDVTIDEQEPVFSR